MKRFRRVWKMFSLKGVLIGSCLIVFAGCSGVQPEPPVDKDSADPGGTVSRGEKKLALLGSPIALGKPIPSTALVDSVTMETVDLSQESGKVLFLSIVPSIDTPVCEAQTHVLGEEGDRLPPEVRRITVSRDTPFAQRRFAKESKLQDIQYLSDYKRGDFGRSTGLLLEGPEILARTIIIVDKKGMVRYIQVVPEISHLPDMERAFQEAIKLSKENHKEVKAP